MKKILVIHGLDHDKMGKDANSPHTVTMETLNKQMEQAAGEMDVSLSFYQNNDIKKVCDTILAAPGQGVQGIVFNPAAWMDSGVEIAQALKQAGLPVVEVHMSNINKEVTCSNVIAPAVTGLVTGFGESVYVIGLRMLSEYLCNQ